MALKALLTDLTNGVKAYPNHNTPSTAGGFNYGSSYTPVFEGVFRQKSFEFGKGRTSDRPGGAFSNEPYLYSGLLSADQLPDIPNPGDTSFLDGVGDFVDSATDGLIRGGLLTAIKRSAQDVLRIGKWAYDGPGGPAWLLTQTGLQRSNPKTEEKGISFLGIDLGGTSRVYNPLGINTIAQSLTNFAGLHINRAGLLPGSYGVRQGHNIDSTEDTKYEFNVKAKADINVIGYQDKGNFEGNRLLNLASLTSATNLYEYSGGPHSIYGIGRTTLKRYEPLTGPSSKFNKLGILNNATKNYNAGIESYSPYNVTATDVNQDVLFKGSNSGGPYGGGYSDINGRKLIYKNTDFDVEGAYKVKTSEITDFRKSMGRGFTDYQLKTGANNDGVKYIREERINLGNPGTRINRAVDKLGRLDYSVYSPETVDKINALDIIRTKGDFTSQKYRDLIRFRIEAVDSDKPNESDSMIFRAFLDGFNDSYNASHNSFKYNGRGENFYTYNSFTRKVSFSFKIAAQSRHEMMPLYRKLNFLVSNVAPEYKVTRMRTPFIRLTIGSMIDRVPGVLNSVSLKWDKNYPWEIALDGPEKTKRDILVLPHVLDVSVSFTPVHNFLPKKSITDSPFIISHKNNRSLQRGEQWYKEGAAETLEEASIEGLRKRMGLDPLTKLPEMPVDETGRTETTDDIIKGKAEEGKESGDETSTQGSSNPAGASGTGGAAGGATGGAAARSSADDNVRVSSKTGGGTKGAADASTPKEEAKKDAQIPIPKTPDVAAKETKHVGDPEPLPEGIAEGDKAFQSNHIDGNGGETTKIDHYWHQDSETKKWYISHGVKVCGEIISNYWKRQDFAVVGVVGMKDLSQESAGDKCRVYQNMRANGKQPIWPLQNGPLTKDSKIETATFAELLAWHADDE